MFKTKEGIGWGGGSIKRFVLDMLFNLFIRHASGDLKQSLESCGKKM